MYARLQCFQFRLLCAYGELPRVPVTAKDRHADQADS